MPIVSTALLALLSAAQAVPPPAVPGGCTAPAAQNIGKPGCYLSAELPIALAPAELYWHISSHDSEVNASREAKRHELAVVVRAHERWWLHVLSPKRAALPSGMSRHVAGPFKLVPGEPIVARFMESWFPPGMRTRVHSHSGPEAFYVIEGQQCVETPSEQRIIAPGQSYIVEEGAHLQAAPEGRRSLVLILARPNEPWMQLEAWQPSGYCDS